MRTCRTLLAGTWGLLSLFAARAGEPQPALTPQAETALRNLFPAAQILAVATERERGVRYYEVALRQGQGNIEIEVAPDGSVGEIETRVAPAEVPRAAMEGILQATGGSAVLEVERHEVRGAPQNGTFIPVQPPRVFYEARYEVEGVRREVAVSPDGSPLAADEAEDHQAGAADLDDDDD